MAQSLERARDLYKAGKYDQAKPIFETLIKKSPNNSSLNQWYGVCLYETGEYNASEKYLKVAASRKIQDSYLYLGDLIIGNIDFPMRLRIMKSIRRCSKKVSKIPRR